MKLFVVTLYFLMCFANIVNAEVDDGDPIHVATVTEMINGGGYTYIQCDENGKSKWLMLPEINIAVGDRIEFPDRAPMVNFTSKSINKRFTQIYVVPGLRKIAKGESVVRYRSMYKSEDENGTLVFTDNPASLPVKKGKK
jgi:hypothetical protein